MAACGPFASRDYDHAMIEGRLTRLRALRSEDAAHHLRWRNDPEVVRWAAAGDPCFGPVTAEAVALAFDTMLRLSPRESAVSPSRTRPGAGR